MYYPADSLKMRLCLRGRHLLYDHCQDHNVPFKKIGKLIVAQQTQLSYIEGLHKKAATLQRTHPSHPSDPQQTPLPLEIISGDKAREMEPDLSPDIVAALWSPETGIVDSHTLMESFESDIAESEGGELAYSTAVVRVDPYQSRSPDNSGWVVQTLTGDAKEPDVLLAKTLINCSGLSGPFILNSLLPKDSRIPMYYARGSYASYKGPGLAHVSHLIYPCPGTGRTAHAFQSLGTHLTVDLDGNVRFGPDVDWLQPPSSEEGEVEVVYDSNPDFWQASLVPDESRLRTMHEAIQEYLPAIAFDGLSPDYCGIRPKLVGPGGAFQDFVVRVDHPETFLGEQTRNTEHRNPMITLMGIESPGLTSCLSLAEMVVDDILCERDRAP